MNGYIYLASPYSHPEEAMRTRRYQAALRATARLLDTGVHVFSPIVHAHNLKPFMTKPDLNSFSTWQRFDETMLKSAAELWVYCIPGWEESVGVIAEIEFAQHLPIPVQHISPPSGEWEGTDLANSRQVGGKHYQVQPIQPWDYISSNNLSFLAGNVVKYVSRFHLKDGRKDLEKAKHYLEKLIEVEDAKP